MSNNLITNSIDICLPLVMDSFSGNLGLLYYSHIPVIAISLFFGFFILIRGKGELLSKVFFLMALLLSLWSILDLFTWLSWDTRVQMFAWSITTLVEPLLFVVSLYFIYVFIKKKDAALKYKFLVLTILLPLIVFMATRFNLYAFNSSECYSLESNYGLNYKYFVEIISLFAIALFSIVSFKKADKYFREQILILLIGIALFLFSFFSVVFLGGYLAEVGWGMSGYKFELYGLFGAVTFMGFLAYLIVKHKAFNIKLLGTQALVVAMNIIIAAQYFFVESNMNIILIGVTLILALGFGYVLVKSVKQEVERKEQLQVMADKLSAANDQLRKLDNAKTEFISIASHQLRTPLTSIKGFVSLIIEGSYGEINDKAKDALEKVYASSERLVHLVEDLLNVSRIESGRMQFTFEKSDIGELMKELYENFILVAKSKDLYLDFKLPDEKLPMVSMDPAKMREVISNFTDNALKYTEKGGVVMKGEKTENNTIKITISDTGIGVPADEMPYLFKKFSRGKDTGRLHATGTGLGLYVAKNIIEAHHGKVWIESDGAGKGSRFIIELPIEQAA
ncbi:MAG: PAS/PAC sensor signal transduction histidine kinase [uncultured bacterium]|nr:MAG: PAS/PAC sensor signal transduction histidine kinase [uncultured bacterium]HBR71379.1 hypothetical protein [Candidatus Moranbacteria bacterium]